MTDKTLKHLLTDYTAPTPDDGFSDRLVMAMKAEAQAEALAAAQALAQANATIDLSDFMPSRNPVKRGWIVSLILGLMAGLLWTQLGISLPDVNMDAAPASILEQSWVLYGLIGCFLIGSFLFLEADSY
jgi:hypothetical protein